MDKIFVSAKIEKDEYDGKPYLYTIVEINGNPLVNYEREEFAIDLVALAKTVDQDGDFFIITCTCGDAGCAGITEGIHVVREQGTLQWFFPKSREDVEEVRTYTFDAESYIAAIEHGFIQFLELFEENPDIETSPFLLRGRIEYARKQPGELLLLEGLLGSGS
jgi:hypothetical protein